MRPQTNIPQRSPQKSPDMLGYNDSIGQKYQKSSEDQRIEGYSTQKKTEPTPLVVEDQIKPLNRYEEKELFYLQQQRNNLYGMKTEEKVETYPPREVEVNQQQPEEIIVDEDPIEVENKEIIISAEPSVDVQANREQFKSCPEPEVEQKEEVKPSSFKSFLEKRRLAAQQEEKEIKIEDSDSEVRANQSNATIS